jgi:hypothetical protein
MLLLLLMVAMPEAMPEAVVVAAVVEAGVAESNEDKDELFRSDRVLLRLPNSMAADTLLAESGGDATKSTPLLLPDSAATNALTASAPPNGVELNVLVLLGASVGGVLVGGATVTPAKAPRFVRKASFIVC